MPEIPHLRDQCRSSSTRHVRYLRHSLLVDRCRGAEVKFSKGEGEGRREGVLAGPGGL